MSIEALLEDEPKLREISLAAFKQLDTDQNGILNWKEIDTVMNQVAIDNGISSPSKEDILNCMQDLDINQDNVVDVDEFYQFLKSTLQIQALKELEEEENRLKQQQDEDEQQQENEKNNQNENQEEQEEEENENEKEENTNKQKDKQQKQQQSPKKQATPDHQFRLKKNPNNNKSNLNQRKQDEKKLIKSMQEELKQIQADLYQQKSNNQAKLVYTFLNAKTDKKEVEQKQFQLKNTKNQLLNNSIIKLNPLISAQNLKSGTFKTVEDIQNAQLLFKNTPLLGLAMQRPKNEKFQEFFDIVNQYTDDEFDKTPSRIQFERIDEKVKKNTQYLILHIETISYTNVKDLKVNNELEIKRTDKPTQYCWEVKFNQKSLFLNSFKALDNQSNECLDFLFQNNYIYPLEVILWKQQKFDSVYIGQFNIFPEEFEAFEEIFAHPNTKILKLRKSQSKVLEKNVQFNKIDTQRSIKKQIDAFQGVVTIKYKILQYADKVEPQNSISGVVGSPRSIEERRRRRLVEDSKYNPYQWPDDQRNKDLVILIRESAGEIIVITTEEDVQNFFEFNAQVIAILMDTNLFAMSEGQINRKFKTSGRIKLTPQVMDLLKSLEEDPNKTVYTNFRKTMIKGRVKKADLDAALQSLGCSATMLFLDKKNEIGMCEMDFQLDCDEYGIVLDTVGELNLGAQENANELEDFTEILFNNIKKQLKKNLRLEPLVEFLRQASLIPDFGIIFTQFAIQYQLSSTTPQLFLNYFDINNYNLEKMDNYEHVMVLGKIRKIVKEYVPQLCAFQEDLQKAYDDAKMGIYFSVPVLPKKLNIEEKKHLLVIDNKYTSIDAFEFVEDGVQELNKGRMKFKKMKYKRQAKKNPEEKCLWNIFHECVRRRRWNMVYKGFAAAPDMFYVKNHADLTPLMYLLKQGPYEAILSLLTDFAPEKQDEGIIPLDIEKTLKMTTNQDVNIFHQLCSNCNPIIEGQLKTLQKLITFINNEEKVAELLQQPIKQIQITPLVMYVNKLANNQNNMQQSDEEVIKQIIQILGKPIKKEFPIHKYRAMMQLIVSRIPLQEAVDIQDYYLNHVQLTKAMAQQQEKSLTLLQSELPHINWFGMNLEIMSLSETQFAIYNLARQGKISQIEDILKKFEVEYKTLTTTLLNNKTMQFANDQNCIEQDGDQIVFKSFDESVKYNYTQAEFIDKFSEFYKKYPIDLLIGIQQELNGFKYSAPKLTKLIKSLIETMIKEEPRLLCKFFSIRQKNICQELKDIGFQDILVGIPGVDEFLEKQSIHPLMKAMENKDITFLESSYISYQKTIENIFKSNEASKLLDFLPELKKSSIYATLGPKIGTIILQQLLKSTGGQKLSKFIIAFKNQPELIKKSALNTTYNGAALSKNISLQNHLLALSWNPKFKYNLLALINNHYQYAATVHPALVFNQKQFQLFLDDIKDCQSQADYSVMAYALARNCQPIKLSMILGRIKNPDILFTLLRESMIQASSKQAKKNQNLIPPKYAPKYIQNFHQLGKILMEGIFQKPNPNINYPPIVRPYTVATKKVALVSAWFLFPVGMVQTLIFQAALRYSSSNNLPRTFSYYLSVANNNIYSQIYTQSLRKTFLNQKPVTIFSNFQLSEPKDPQKTVEDIIKAINTISIDEAITKNGDIQKMLKKTYYLPLFTDQTALIQKSPNPNRTTLKAIDLLLQQFCKLHPTQSELISIKLNFQRAIKFISDNFKKNLVPEFANQFPKIRRIIRTLDFTLKKTTQKEQVQFAVEVTLILVRNFEQQDFNQVVTTNIDKFFNALAVALMRSKTEYQPALEWMGTQLNNYQFYELVHAVSLPDEGAEDGVAKKSKEKNLMNQISTFPENIEIEEAVRLLTPSLQNVDYFLKLLKFKVKPFRKRYSLNKPLNCSHFNCGVDSIQDVTLLEYMCLRNHQTLLKKYFMKALKPKNALSPELRNKWLFIACASGSYNVFEMIQQEILQMSVQQIINSSQELPIFYQIIASNSIKQAELFFQKIYKGYLFNGNNTPIQQLFDTLGFKENQWNKQSILLIIEKKYTSLYWIIIEYFQQIYTAQDKQLQCMKQFLNLTFPQLLVSAPNDKEANEKEPEIKAVEVEEVEEVEEIYLTILEYSLSQGFPDLAMSSRGVELVRNPFSRYIFAAIKQDQQFFNCGSELLKDEKILKKNQDKIRAPYYQLYLALRPFVGPEVINKLATSVMLFWILKSYDASRIGFDSHITQLANINAIDIRRPFNPDLPSTIGLKEPEILYTLHIGQFDKVMKYNMSLVEFKTKYYPEINPFWLSKDIQKILKDYFETDILVGRAVYEQKEADVIYEAFKDSQYFMQQYFILNHYQVLIENCNENDLELYNYTMMICFLRIASQDQNVNLEEFIRQYFSLDEERMNLALIVYLIIDTNYQKKETKEYIQLRIIGLVEGVLKTISLADFARKIWQLLNRLSVDKFYQNLIKYQQVSKQSTLNNKIMSEKSFIQGILDIIYLHTKFPNLVVRVSQKDILRLLDLEMPKQNPMQLDKIFRGLQVLKMALEILIEIESINQLLIENTEYDIELQLAPIEQVKKNDVQLNKVVKNVDEDQDFVNFKYFIKLPIMFWEEKGWGTVLIHPNHKKSMKNLVNKHNFENLKLKQLLESAATISLYIGETQTYQTLNYVNINSENYPIISEYYEQQFLFGKGLEEMSPELQVTLESFNEGKSNIVNRGKGLTFEEEVAPEKYFNYEQQIELKASLLTKEQFVAKCRREVQLRYILDDIRKVYQLIKQENQTDKARNNIDWPFYIDENSIVTDNFNFPLYGFVYLTQQISSFFQNNYMINYISFIDTYIQPFAQLFEAMSKTNSMTQMSEILTQSLSWPLLVYSLQAIYDILKASSSNIIFEMTPITKQKVINYNSQFDGYDAVIRFGPTTYFFHKGFFVVRFGIAFIRNDITPILKNGLTAKQRLEYSIKQDIQPYIDSIINMSEIKKIQEFAKYEI